MCKLDRRFKGLGVAVICVLWVVPCIVIFAPFWYSWNWVNRGCAFPNSSSCGWNCQVNTALSTSTQTYCNWCNTASYPNSELCVTSDTTATTAGFNMASFPCSDLSSAPAGSSFTTTDLCNYCVFGGVINLVTQNITWNSPTNNICQENLGYNMMQNVSDGGLLATAIVFTVLCAIGIFMMGIVWVFCCKKSYYGTPGGVVVAGDKGDVYRPAVGGAPAAGAANAAGAAV